MTIPLVDLSAQYQPLKEDILRRIDEILSLPMYPELTAEQRAYVVEAIREFCGRGG